MSSRVSPKQFVRLVSIVADRGRGVSAHGLGDAADYAAVRGIEASGRKDGRDAEVLAGVGGDASSGHSRKEFIVRRHSGSGARRGSEFAKTYRRTPSQP